MEPNGGNKIYYHGSSDAVLNTDKYKLLPPKVTGQISEKGRNKNLDKVFFTTDFNSANIYAGRAVQQFGGNPVVFRVIPMGEISKMHDMPGTSVYYSDWAFYEPKNLLAGNKMESIDFKEWLLLNEMPHISVAGCISGICAMDLKFEDWKLDGGHSLQGGIPLGFSPMKPFALKFKDKWLLSKSFGEPLQLTNKKPPDNYQIVPEGWESYAEFFDSNYEVIKPAKFDSVKRLSAVV